MLRSMEQHGNVWLDSVGHTLWNRDITVTMDRSFNAWQRHSQHFLVGRVTWALYLGCSRISLWGRVNKSPQIQFLDILTQMWLDVHTLLITAWYQVNTNDRISGTTLKKYGSLKSFLKKHLWMDIWLKNYTPPQNPQIDATKFTLYE